MLSTGVLIAIAAGAAVLLIAVQVMRSWLRMRGARVVTCPETGRKVGVELDARSAAFVAVVSGRSLHLSSCTRWPERQGCGQECLSEVEQSGESCLIRSILTDWYKGKSCANCGLPIGDIDWAVRKPALMTPAGTTIEWSQVPAETIDDVLATHKPVCFACHVTYTLARQHPELIIPRQR